MIDLTGKQFGAYRLTTRLGQGGMGVVYRAYQSTMDRDVAVKVLPVEQASDPAFAVRFRQEALFLARLQHPHILPIFDYGEADGCVYLVMPLIQSGTLADLMRGQMLSLSFITSVMAQLGDALDYAHAQGFVHRDIKPQNILVDARGNCLLADFGIAKLLDATAHLTHTGGVIGTPAYMSPEQGQGLPVDARSDIYSLGVVLYQMVTGRVPFEGTTPLGLIFKHVNSPLPAPRRLNPAITPALENVIIKALAKAPADRFATAGALAQALTTTAAGQHGPNPKNSSRSVTRFGSPLAAAVFVAGGLSLAGVLGLLMLSVIFRPFARPAANSSPAPTTAVSIPVATVVIPVAPPTTLPSAIIVGTPVPLILASATRVPATNALATNVPATEVLATRVVPTAIRPATARPVLGATQRSPADGMVLHWVPAGDFIMGSTPNDAGSRANEYPQRRVTLDGFWIDEEEITNAQYADFLNNLGRSDREAGAWLRLSDGNALLLYHDSVWQPMPGFGQHPVANVSWDGADAYCRWAKRRLPSEAEWEKAARGPDGAIYPWGNTAPTGNQANFADRSAGAATTEDDGFARSAPVGSFPAGASPYGALDMAGNVWEWVADWYDAAYYASAPALNPHGPATGSFRVLRGGSWNGDPTFLRAAARGGDVPFDAVNFDFGFRCATDFAP